MRVLRRMGCGGTLTVGGATSPEDLGLVDPSFPLTDMMMDHSHSFHDGVAEAAPATAGPCTLANSSHAMIVVSAER